MTPDLSAILVHFRQPELAARCAATLRAAFGSDGVHGEIVLVDCASGERDRVLLDAIGADTRVDLPENRGYSGGVNAGLARARGPLLLLSNVDVEYRTGSLAPLIAALRDESVGCVAPVCAWDPGDRLLLPPGFDPPFLEELSLLRAGRSPSRDGRRFAAFARDAVRLWTKGGEARHLSGAVLAARREVFDGIGRFDERFTLEYEETEWERRVRRAGLRLEVVAASRVRHAWGARGRPSADAESRRKSSRRLYREMRFGRIGRALLERAESRPQAPSALPRRASLQLPERPGAWLALSPHASGFPFAGADLARPFRAPAEVAAALSVGDWFVSIFSAADGRPLETFVWERPA